MFTQQDLRKLELFLNSGKVINMEVKEYKAKKQKLPVKEVILEYEDGSKLVGDLNQENFDMRELTGLTTIVKYFARGKYGNNSWRGNFSGLLVRDLINHYQPNFVVDPMTGGGTSDEVLNEMGVSHLCLDLNPKWGGFDALKDEVPQSSDFIIWHPPYMVFEGSNMPRYSGVEWGDKPHVSDGSHISDPALFTKWLNRIQANLYSSLRKNGRMGILLGDSRYRGKFYSMFKAMDIYGELEQIVIKEQFNCFSDDIKYSNKNFIPLRHEYLLIIRKTDNFVIPCHIIKNIAIDIRQSEKVSWKVLITATIESLGGKATRKTLYNMLRNHPKARNNNNVEAKIRQILNTYNKDFIKENEDTYMLRPLGDRRVSAIA